MAVLRLANGSDIVVKLSIVETLQAVGDKGTGSDFVELPGEDGPIHIRPSGVIAVIEDARRGTPGFRFGVTQGANPE